MFKRPYFQRIKTFIIKDALWDIEVVMPSGAILKGYIGKVDKGDNRVRLSVILDTTGNEKEFEWLEGAKQCGLG